MRVIDLIKGDYSWGQLDEWRKGTSGREKGAGGWAEIFDMNTNFG